MKRTNSVRKALNPIRLFAIPLLAVSILSVAACSPQPADCAGEDVFCVGMVVSFDGIDDHGLNQAAWETLQNIRSQANIARLDMIESVDTRDWLKNVSFFAENNYDVVVTIGRNLGDITIAVASEYPATQFIGIDQQLENQYTNVAAIYFPTEQAGFLAGLLAAMATEVNKVGAVCESSGIDSVWRYCEGFRAGAQYENEDVRVVVTYRDSGGIDSTFNDPDWGEERASIQIEGGVDVLTGFGGNTAQGAFLLAAEKGIPIISAEEDLYFHVPDLQPVLITSIVNDPREALTYLVVQASQGEILNGPYAGQITYTPFRGPNERLENEAERLLQNIRNGVLELNIPEKE